MPESSSPPHTLPDSALPERPARPSRRLLLLFCLTAMLLGLCALYYVITAGAPVEFPTPPPVAAPAPARSSIATPPAAGEKAGPRLAGSIGLAAHEVSSASLIDQTSRNKSGGFERDIYRTRGLEVTLTNLDRFPSGPLDETILWFARDFSSHPPQVFFAEHRAVEVSSASTAVHRFDSPLAFGHEQRDSIVTARTRTGEKIVAWLIVVRRDQDILAAHGSDADRERLGHDLPALRSLLTQNPPNEQHLVE